MIFFLTVIEKITLYTGRLDIFTDWILKGAVIGVEGGMKKVKNITEFMLSHELPIAGLWI